MRKMHDITIEIVSLKQSGHRAIFNLSLIHMFVHNDGKKRQQYDMSNFTKSKQQLINSVSFTQLIALI